jgi:outer membrane protein assembly factor BamA
MTVRIRAALALLTVLIAAAQPAPAAAQDRVDAYAGRTIASIALQIEGKPETSAPLLALVDIKPGERLSVESWRRVAARFMQLPRFQNVTVLAEDQPSGVRLVFELEPSHPIDKLEFPGETGLSPADLDNAVRDQFGGLPSLEQVNDVEDSVQRYLANEGFGAAQVNATVVPTHDPDRATLVVHITAGPRSMIASLPTIRGTSLLSREEVLSKLGLAVGQPYRLRALLVEEAKLRASLRSQGFYTASVQHQTQLSNDGSQVDVQLTVEAGPKVRLVVDGQLPGKLEDFIAVDREGSVDPDLLDTSRDAITKALKREGYWKALVTYVQDRPSEAEMVITFRIDRGKRYRVDHLELPPGLHLTAEDLKGLTALQPRAWFNDEAVTQNLTRIRALYVLRGYHKVTLDQKIQDVETGSAQEGAVVIVPNITEGPRADVVAVNFDLGDAPQVPATDLREAMFLKEGVPFVPAFVSGDRERLQAHYDSLGFLNATVRVSYTLNAEETAATLAVLAREGPRVVVGEITVVGNKKWSQEDILRELPLKPGMPYSESARLDAQNRLSDLEFRNVRVSTDPRLPGESQVRITVYVEESGAVTLAWGGGGEVASRPRVDANGDVQDIVEVAPRAFIELGRRNFGGRNRSINFFSRVGLKQRASLDEQTQQSGGGFTEYRVTGAYRERHVLRTDADLLAGITFEQAARTNYSFLRRVFNADLARPLTPRTTISGRYTWEFTRVFDNILPPEDQSLIDRLFPQVRLSILSGTLFWNGKTTQSLGHQLSTSIDFALPGLGSEVGFVKNFSQASTVRALGQSGKYALALRAQLGLARGFERDVPRVDADGNPVLDESGEQLRDRIADLPASQRFYAGGSSTVRGFQLDRLGVQEILNDDGLSDGGNGVVVFNAEIRARVGKLFGRNFGVVGFVDAGNVFDRAGDLDLKRLRPTAGMGFRYDSWIGPLRIDVGYKLDSYVFRNAKEKRWEFYLSLGEIF